MFKCKFPADVYQADVCCLRQTICTMEWAGRRRHKKRKPAQLSIESYPSDWPMFDVLWSTRAREGWHRFIEKVFVYEPERQEVSLPELVIPIGILRVTYEAKHGKCDPVSKFTSYRFFVSVPEHGRGAGQLWLFLKSPQPCCCDYYGCRPNEADDKRFLAKHEMFRRQIFTETFGNLAPFQGDTVRPFNSALIAEDWRTVLDSEGGIDPGALAEALQHKNASTGCCSPYFSTSRAREEDVSRVMSVDEQEEWEKLMGMSSKGGGNGPTQESTV